MSRATTTSDDSVQAGGQVRVALPGEDACLVCCGGYDPSQAAIDQLDDAGRARHAAAGYVQGAQATATPSVANLNALTAQHAVSAFLALVNGGDFSRWDYLHFDQFTGRTSTIRNAFRPRCRTNRFRNVTNTGVVKRHLNASRPRLVMAEIVLQPNLWPVPGIVGVQGRVLGYVCRAMRICSVAQSPPAA